MFSLAILGLVSFGGAIGASCRYIITVQTTQLLGHEFPYGTLLANVIGSCIMGGVISALSSTLLDSEAWRPLIVVGFLGALTTFSSFSMDNVLLIEHQEYFKVLINTFLNIFVSISMCYLSFYLVSKL